ncbi:MAG TPA: glycosyltransferase family 2 protein [Acetobacteraceae bacterium]|nr:glycosyltransferase family 2 protein [Acetobacteraceae bacterium]
MNPSRTHVVVIPSYNTGRLLRETVGQALAAWAPVWIVLDGSTDGSGATLDDLAASDPHLTIIDRGHNGGKGAAVLDALDRADATGFTHVLVMDSDGQHPPAYIGKLMAMSAARTNAMVLGRPLFGADAPIERVYWRRLSNFWVDVETRWAGVGDSLFGFRVYPVRPLLEVMRQTRWMRRFDFDPEAAVRLCWAGIHPINVDVPVRYLSAQEGGVSHFRYGRDNLLLGWMHVRLIYGLLCRVMARLRTLSTIAAHRIWAGAGPRPPRK